MTDEDLLRHLIGTMPVNIELGCGTTKTPGYIGIDRIDLDGVDYVHDLEQGLGFLPSNSVDEVTSRHFLEHVENFEHLMREIHRVLKPDGRHVAVVPHFSNPYYYSDYTHRRFFGLYTFDYFAPPEAQMKRGVPSFYTDFRFKVIERELVFKSPFPVRNLFKQAQRRCFNATPWMQEYYEENLCYLYPCQELRFVMVPVDK